MTSFISNGLLGSSSSSTTAGPSKDALTFTSNGLLGSSLQQDGEAIESSETPSLSVSFISNGLLSSRTTTTTASSPAATTDGGSDEITTRSDYEPSPAPDAIPSAPTLTFGQSALPQLSVRAVSHDGKTVIIRKKPKIIYQAAPPPSTSTSFRSLLDIPIHRMMDGLSLTAARRLDEASNEALFNPGEVETELWVDRYRPEKFTELVGNERTARDAMTWLKQWDWCVFGRNKGKKRSRDEEDVELDEFHRPREKVLLLSGPAGLGKTTLAHVIAQHAGYEVVEINASDARSGSVVDDRIRPTLESGYTVGSNKPVLLVLDEIDGATGSGENANTFIHKLVALVTAKPKKKKQRSGQKGDATRPILRPIICICNDQNAASLAKLRPHAHQVRFIRPADVHLVKRLKEICQIEGLNADNRALGALVSIAKGDLRGCLNTLQFIKARNEDVNEAVIRRATAGMKEADSSVSNALNNIFNPLSKKVVKDLGLGEEEESRYIARLVREIDAVGRESTLASGCFGHYATRRRHDANLSLQEKAIHWLETYDLFSSAMYSDGDFALYPYIPYTLVPFYPLFSERGGDKVERNQTEWEHMQLTRTNEEIYKSLSKGARAVSLRTSGAFQQLLGSPILQLEFAPLINRIISPPLRPVNSQIVRPQEKALMGRLVDIMAALDLRFVQERSEDGQLSYRLDPPIDVFVTYDGKRAADIAVSRYAVRHLVAGEIDAKIAVRDTEYIEKDKVKKSGFFNKTSADAKLDQEGDGNSPNKRRKTDTRDIADKPPTDFFGRLVNVSTTDPATGETKIVEKKFRVVYKFLEGNSAAVRKPVKVNTFL